MSEKLRMKHTNSSALNKHKLLLEESETKSCCPHLKPYRLAIFCILVCCIFLIYWIILTPLLFNVLTEYRSNNTDKWFSGLVVLYWLIAFVVWLFIMLCLILIWRCSNSKHDDNEKLQLYGTNGSLMSGRLISAELYPSQTVKLKDMKQDGSSSDPIYNKAKIGHEKPNTNTTDESERNKVKKHKDLPPLVIHRRNSGNGIERVGTVNVEKHEDKNDEARDKLKSGSDDRKTERESMKEYLKLVTVTPQDELDTKSPKGPLSPRELFFIDLIREAEKAEQSKAKNPQGTEGKYFFSNNFSPTKKNVDKMSSEEKKAKMPTTKNEQETTYFIADVESPKSEKAEVYLEIDPDPETVKQWSVSLHEEKPILMLQDSAKNEENENTNGKVVLFEV